MALGPIRRAKAPGFAFLHGRARTAYMGIPETGQALMGKIDAHLRAQGIKPLGPVVWAYDHVGDDQHVWLNAGIPVPPRSKPGKLKIEKVPAWTCFTALYRGSMLGIQDAWQALMDKAEAAGLKGPFQTREFYRKWIAFDSKDNITVVQLRILHKKPRG